MEIRGKEYKLSDILFIAFVLIFFISFIKLEPDKALEVYQQELIEKESWLIYQLNDIANFINFNKNEFDYINRKVWFTAWYVSPEFNEKKLLRLHSFLLKEGWVDMTDKIDKNDYIIKTSSRSDEASNHVRILCNNKATIFMYMIDMRNYYEYKSFKTGTLVELLYDSSLPCYNLDEKKYENSSDIELNN
ncbi:hypothetical protein [Psychrobacter sp. ASPA161_6]|uniref:hypothetical protein n=1 Tax=Psychrobacter sp. ASPA161_6 TaxID=3160962 RepID=UPI003F81919A